MKVYDAYGKVVMLLPACHSGGGGGHGGGGGYGNGGDDSGASDDSGLNNGSGNNGTGSTGDVDAALCDPQVSASFSGCALTVDGVTCNCSDAVCAGNALEACLGTIGADEAVRREAVARFDAGDVVGDLANAVLATIGAINRPGDFDTAFERFRAAKDPQSENRYRRSLTQFQDVGLTTRCFDMCFSEFRLQDVPLQVMGLLANRTGGPAAWELLSARWEEITGLLPSKTVHYLVGSVTTFIADRALAERVAAFHAAHTVESGQRQIDQAVERMLTGVAFAERVRPVLAEQLAP